MGQMYEYAFIRVLRVRSFKEDFFFCLAGSSVILENNILSSLSEKNMRKSKQRRIFDFLSFH
jgi:hypothetical protein